MCILNEIGWTLTVYIHMYSLRLWYGVFIFIVCVHCMFYAISSTPSSLLPTHLCTDQPPRWPALGSDSGTTGTKSLLPHPEMEPRPCPKWCPRPGLHSASERARWEVIWSGARGKWHYSGPSSSDTWEEVRCGGVCQECLRTRGAIGRAGCLHCEIRA